MKLLLKAQYEKLIVNGRYIAATGDDDQEPVVKLFTPDANCTWLLVSLDPHDSDIAYGLCDLGLGFAEIGTVRLSEITSLRGPLGLFVERDRHWKAQGTLSWYADQAQKAGGQII